MIQIDGKYTSAIVYHDVIDETSMSQIHRMVNSPGVNGPVRIMPDFHAGKGSVVGFTMPIKDIVVPNIVGVDIGCGMLLGRINRPNFSLEEIDAKIRSVVPVGFALQMTKQYDKFDNFERFYKLAEDVGVDAARLELSPGTLGGGNHFIEYGMSSNDGEFYITIHSGSRNFGKVVAETFQRRAVDYSADAPDVTKEMEYMPANDYIEGMDIAQQYAALNRDIMLRNIAKVLETPVLSKTDCVHNYISPKDRIIRKGAVSARTGETIVLPFNRSEGIWVMEGLGNEEWNYSAPHGAGRRMSRSQAKRELTQEYVDLEMKETGVYSSFNPIDEAPDAYKSPDEIRKYIGETAKYLYSIKPILNIKG